MSLPQQRDAIERYAATHQLTISQWFQEMETAAERGRPVFGQVVEKLRSGQADGVIIHKIDRSTRNYHDLGDIHELMDAGFEVHSAHDGMILNPRGARLYADLQAVMAVDYIRNLREEARKGYYGRLKQGIAPFPAPLGYLDQGAGKPKALDPSRSPLVKLAFERYATARVGLRQLTREITQAGLTTKKGRTVSTNMLNRMLANPFYCGLIRLRRSKQFFAGAHEPLVSKALFDDVQAVMSGRVPRRTNRHSFTFSRMIQCRNCGRKLIGERQKGLVYYRCHSKDCIGTSLAETLIKSAIRPAMFRLKFTEPELNALAEVHQERRDELTRGSDGQIRSLELKLGQSNDRLGRLTDALLDGALDKEIFEQRKIALLSERRNLEDKINELKTNPQLQLAELDKFVELTKHAYSVYENGTSEEMREVLQSVMSNFSADRKIFTFSWLFPFSEVASRQPVLTGGPHRDTGRTFWKEILKKARLHV